MALRKRYFGKIEDIPESIAAFEDCSFLFGAAYDPKAFIWMQPAEGRWLWDCVKNRPPGSAIVEIGRCEGGSAILMGAAKEPEDVLVSIDIDPVDDPQVAAMIAKLGLENIKLVIGDGSKYLTERVQGVGLVFIDGGHEYDDVKGDFENWFPAVIPGGIILFHDVHDSPGKTNAVGRFFHEAVKEHGLEIIGRAGTLMAVRK